MLDEIENLWGLWQEFLKLTFLRWCSCLLYWIEGDDGKELRDQDVGWVPHMDAELMENGGRGYGGEAVIDPGTQILQLSLVFEWHWPCLWLVWSPHVPLHNLAHYCICMFMPVETFVPAHTNCSFLWSQISTQLYSLLYWLQIIWCVTILPNSNLTLNSSGAIKAHFLFRLYLLHRKQ